MKTLRNLAVFGLLVSAAIVLQTASARGDTTPSCQSVFPECQAQGPNCVDGSCWCNPESHCSTQTFCIEGWQHYQWVCSDPNEPFTVYGSGYCWPNPTYGC
jgi:hypothetical protein